ncbi:unnamed protein product [Peronospora destructor]|uniref:HIT domain-containing protein n=1 Tax=Peronospora destructor TaxID=86335 RepID=A0AAV0VFV8_9STRA|nr:unnamed protein product [Peronospora destructor]
MAVSKELEVSLDRTLLVTESTLLEDADNDVISIMISQGQGVASISSTICQSLAKLRPVQLYHDMFCDLWTTAQLVGKQLELHYCASSLTFAIHDGKEAGQTITHVHIHVIPRIAQDFKCNDDIYTKSKSTNKLSEAALLHPYFS